MAQTATFSVLEEFCQKASYLRFLRGAKKARAPAGWLAPQGQRTKQKNHQGGVSLQKHGGWKRKKCQKSSDSDFDLILSALMA